MTPGETMGGTPQIAMAVIPYVNPKYLSRGLVQAKSRQSTHRRDTRQSEMPVTPAIRSESGRRRLSYAAVSEYNELPTELRSLSYPAVKRQLREYLRERDAPTS